MTKSRLAVLISGRGSNMKSLMEACAAEDYPAEIAVVISNRPNAPGLDAAARAGLPTISLDHKRFARGDEGRAEFEAELQAALDEAKVDYICLAGFMRLLTADFVRQWRGKIINIHPSLLPAFKGLSVHERMIEQGVKIAGCTVHFVSAAMDAGPIIGQAAIAVQPGDTAESLAARILVEEHKLYPECVKLVASGKARLSSGEVVILPDTGEDVGALHQPRIPSE